MDGMLSRNYYCMCISFQVVVFFRMQGSAYFLSHSISITSPQTFFHLSVLWEHFDSLSFHIFRAFFWINR